MKWLLHLEGAIPGSTTDTAYPYIFKILESTLDSAVWSASLSVIQLYGKIPSMKRAIPFCTVESHGHPLAPQGQAISGLELLFYAFQAFSPSDHNIHSLSMAIISSITDLDEMKFLVVLHGFLKIVLKALTSQFSSQKCLLYGLEALNKLTLVDEIQSRFLQTTLASSSQTAIECLIQVAQDHPSNLDIMQGVSRIFWNLAAHEAHGSVAASSGALDCLLSILDLHMHEAFLVQIIIEGAFQNLANQSETIYFLKNSRVYSTLTKILEIHAQEPVISSTIGIILWLLAIDNDVRATLGTVPNLVDSILKAILIQWGICLAGTRLDPIISVASDIVTQSQTTSPSMLSPLFAFHSLRNCAISPEQIRGSNSSVSSSSFGVLSDRNSSGTNSFPKISGAVVSRRSQSNNKKRLPSSDSLRRKSLSSTGGSGSLPSGLQHSHSIRRFSVDLSLSKAMNTSSSSSSSSDESSFSSNSLSSLYSTNSPIIRKIHETLPRPLLQRLDEPWFNDSSLPSPLIVLSELAHSLYHLSFQNIQNQTAILSSEIMNEESGSQCVMNLFFHVIQTCTNAIKAILANDSRVENPEFFFSIQLTPEIDAKDALRLKNISNLNNPSQKKNWGEINNVLSLIEQLCKCVSQFTVTEVWSLVLEQTPFVETVSPLFHIITQIYDSIHPEYFPESYSSISKLVFSVLEISIKLIGNFISISSNIQLVAKKLVKHETLSKLISLGSWILSIFSLNVDINDTNCFNLDPDSYSSVKQLVLLISWCIRVCSMKSPVFCELLIKNHVFALLYSLMKTAKENILDESQEKIVDQALKTLSTLTLFYIHSSEFQISNNDSMVSILFGLGPLSSPAAIKEKIFIIVNRLSFSSSIRESALSLLVNLAELEPVRHYLCDPRIVDRLSALVVSVTKSSHHIQHIDLLEHLVSLISDLSKQNSLICDSIINRKVVENLVEFFRKNFKWNECTRLIPVHFTQRTILNSLSKMSYFCNQIDPIDVFLPLFRSTLEIISNSVYLDSFVSSFFENDGLLLLNDAAQILICLVTNILFSQKYSRDFSENTKLVDYLPILDCVFSIFKNIETSYLFHSKSMQLSPFLTTSLQLFQKFPSLFNLSSSANPQNPSLIQHSIDQSDIIKHSIRGFFHKILSTIKTIICHKSYSISANFPQFLLDLLTKSNLSFANGYSILIVLQEFFILNPKKTHHLWNTPVFSDWMWSLISQICSDTQPKLELVSLLSQMFRLICICSGQFSSSSFTKELEKHHVRFLASSHCIIGLLCFLIHSQPKLFSLLEQHKWVSLTIYALKNMIHCFTLPQFQELASIAPKQYLSKYGVLDPDSEQILSSKWSSISSAILLYDILFISCKYSRGHNLQEYSLNRIQTYSIWCLKNLSCGSIQLRQYLIQSWLRFGCDSVIDLFKQSFHSLLSILVDEFKDITVSLSLKSLPHSSSATKSVTKAQNSKNIALLNSQYLEECLFFLHNLQLDSSSKQFFQDRNIISNLLKHSVQIFILGQDVNFVQVILHPDKNKHQNVLLSQIFYILSLQLSMISDSIEDSSQIDAPFCSNIIHLFKLFFQPFSKNGLTLILSSMKHANSKFKTGFQMFSTKIFWLLNQCCLKLGTDVMELQFSPVFDLFDDILTQKELTINNVPSLLVLSPNSFIHAIIFYSHLIGSDSSYLLRFGEDNIYSRSTFNQSNKASPSKFHPSAQFLMDKRALTDILKRIPPTHFRVSLQLKKLILRLFGGKVNNT